MPLLDCLANGFSGMAWVARVTHLFVSCKERVEHGGIDGLSKWQMWVPPTSQSLGGQLTGARQQVMKESRKSQDTEGQHRDLQVIQGSKHFPVGLVLSLFSTFRSLNMPRTCLSTETRLCKRA